METIIKWNEGKGNITATYNGSGDGPISFNSDDNEGIDREQNIEVKTTDGLISASINIKQIGLREVFNCTDGEFILSDNTTFNVLKNN